MIKVTNARFLQSCERFSQAPSILGAEIAILGRSNVGKSSLINALLNHKNLAKSSATPGKTRLINFFSAKWKVDCALDSANKKNLSLRADSQNLRGNPPCEKMQDSQERLPRSHSLARNDEILDSSLHLRSAQNDKNGVRVAESSETTPQDAEFEIRILDFPGFGYAKVSKTEKSSWDRHLSEFLNKRDSIKLYLHLIDARHQNLAIDNEIFAFLNRFKRGDSAILQVFTKADKLGKNELVRLKKQNKFYHAINDKNSTEILRIEILKTLYNVDF